MRNIVCLSGGLASAWVAQWAKSNLTDVVYYFNDTKWEHKDLYRFLGDIERVLEISITYDSDGRNPEEVAYDQHMLPNNRVPFCSRVLKAERLQKFASPGDSCFFGIDSTEEHRAIRIRQVYTPLEVVTRFPLIETGTTKEQVRKAIDDLGIEIPEMYKMGFPHNNCSGGCVRAGAKTWSLLLEKMPEVYAERERMERDFSLFVGKRVSFMKEETLEQLRNRIQTQGVLEFEDDDKTTSECIGVCNLTN